MNEHISESHRRHIEHKTGISMLHKSIKYSGNDLTQLANNAFSPSRRAGNVVAVT
jgi:hypothetical protein